MKHTSSGPDALDTRTVFRIYATCAAVAGAVALFAPPGIGTTLVTVEAERRTFLQLTGCLLIALGCAVAGFGEIEDPRSRHRALGWFAFAHVVALAGVVSVAATTGGIHNGDLLPPVLVALCVLLFQFWQSGDGYRAAASVGFTKLFGGSEASDDRLRSAYEERIREAASQEERHRLARDLHDSVKQQIYAMQTAAATVQARFGADDAGAREAIERLRESGREAMAEMEAMLDSLRATPLTMAGLVEAIKKQAEALQFRTGAHVSVEVGALPPEEAVVPGAQQAIFKVAQEAFANVGRHARARDVTVRLGLEDSALVLTVRDDGAGFEQPAPATGMGLANMRERAAVVGANFELRSRPGAGTTVILSVPSASRTAGELAAYRRSAIAWGLACVGLAAIVLAAWSRSGRISATVALLVANVILFLRAVFVYRRARRRGEV